MSDDKKITVPRAAATADEGQSNVTNTVSISEEPPNRNRKVKGPSRMLSEAIITSGRFLKLSDKAKVLYMYLMVRTDDEGVVEAYPAAPFSRRTAECGQDRTSAVANTSPERGSSQGREP